MITTYITQLETTGEFIAIVHGETCYHPITVYSQGHADCLNERAGVTAGQCTAAMMCSMFDNWNAFDAIAAKIDGIVREHTTCA